MQTTAAGVWALDDCNGKGAFTHTACNDFEIVAANLLDQDPRGVSERITAYALYIDQPLGRVGMTARRGMRRGGFGEHLMTIGCRLCLLVAGPAFAQAPNRTARHDMNTTASHQDLTSKNRKQIA